MVNTNGTNMGCPLPQWLTVGASTSELIWIAASVNIE